MNASQDLATQPATQDYSPGKGHQLHDLDKADVICILHPQTPATFPIVEHTGIHNPQFFLRDPTSAGARQNASPDGQDSYEVETQHDAAPSTPTGSRTQPMSTSEVTARRLISEHEESTFIQPKVNLPGQLALRFSSKVKAPGCGFLFGRDRNRSDITLDLSNNQKRISNVHFRIFINASGILMLEDLSTNGTIVDGVVVGGRRGKPRSATRMLNPNSTIEVATDNQAVPIRFMVVIPSREGCEDWYCDAFHDYMDLQKSGEGGVLDVHRAKRPPQEQAPASVPPYARTLAEPPGLRPAYGMVWDGGDRYRCAGTLGKGAFATVYLIATRTDGELYAAKELEKKRFMRGGQLDRRLQNEIQIMEQLRHPNVVQFYDTVETDKHLYIIMEYVPFGDLNEFVKSTGRPTLPENLGKLMTRQILSALSHLHDQGITHRDIKPDNILIHCEDPFSVKLTDFGLSKNVNDNETFLKTFCGTLLYCAPEVFPFYDAATRKPQKRQRGAVPRSYSEMVDLWSYAAVLWHVLCAKPPFEGIVDNTGRAMFNNIMGSALDPRALMQHGVSLPCVDLLLSLLTIDPAQRPSIAACLQHPWLSGASVHTLPPIDPMLGSIEEEDEEFYDDDDDDEGDFDYPSLNLDEVNAAIAVESSGSLSSQPIAKRYKPDPRYETREKPEMQSSPMPPPYRMNLDGSSDYETPERARTARTQPAALRSSGVFGGQRSSSSDRLMTQDDIHVHDQGNEYTELATEEEELHFPMPPTAGNELIPREESLGEEVTSMVREMNMESPDSGIGHDNQPSIVPSTPESNSKSRNKGSSQPFSSQDITPKAKQPFRRKIDLPFSASFFYDPYDPSTHNAAYASKVSGIDFTHGGAQDKENKLTTSGSVSDASFAKPQPVLGRLCSTADSFASVAFNITSRITTWGRNPTCTVVYRDSKDTRVPKLAMQLEFHAKGIEEVERNGGDWTQLDDLELRVATAASAGISINGVMLFERNSKGRRCYGRVHTGDEICVSRNQGQEVLKFKVEVSVGRSKKERRSRSSKFEVET